MKITITTLLILTFILVFSCLKTQKLEAQQSISIDIDIDDDETKEESKFYAQLRSSILIGNETLDWVDYEQRRSNLGISMQAGYLPCSFLGIGAGFEYKDLQNYNTISFYSNFRAIAFPNKKISLLAETNWGFSQPIQEETYAYYYEDYKKNLIGGLYTATGIGFRVNHSSGLNFEVMGGYQFFTNGVKIEYTQSYNDYYYSNTTINNFSRYFLKFGIGF